MCVCVFSGFMLWIVYMQTEQVNSENDGSGDVEAERYISFKTTTYCHFCLIVQASLI